MTNVTEFKTDISKGKIGEVIFKEDFLDFLNIKYQDVTGCQQFQVIDSDYLSKVGLFEIKNNYKDDKQIIIEEYTNFNEKYGKIKYGWWYKTKADLVIFVSQKTRTMIFMPINEKIKEHYESIKDKHKLILNKPSKNNNNMWQSAFRKIFLDEFKGYFSYYKKII
uniref:Uncharacterized protein n=2 Tax=viral metagenome TaxID=1070528 RepID=A0A6H2A109_9ZZZZ